MNALELFRFGLDTREIAMTLHISEAQAHEDVTVLRSIEKGLPVPYSDLDTGRFARRKNNRKAS